MMRPDLVSVCVDLFAGVRVGCGDGASCLLLALAGCWSSAGLGLEDSGSAGGLWGMSRRWTRFLLSSCPLGVATI